MPSQPPGRRRALRDILKSRAFAVLPLLLRLPIHRPLTVRAANESYRVTVSVSPANFPDAASGLPGLHFSPLEQMIVEKLSAARAAHPERAVVGKNIAAMIGYPYDSKLKFLLQNLVDRRVLIHGDSDGYSISPGHEPPAENDTEV